MRFISRFPGNGVSRYTINETTVRRRDAPLDDTNTERFARMVQRMSEHTQFLFNTHNKVAMEMAQQLIGITMAESGVSRMVAVDVEEALRLTEQVIL